MKFKKITAIITSVLMAGATVGFAAAANYPAPFVDNGVADVAIVYGTGAGVSSLDMVQAGNIQTSLGNAMPSTGTTIVTDGESFKLEKTSNYFNLNESLNDIYSDLDKDQMDFLADGTYDDGDIDEEYEQKITMGTGILKLFADSDYEDDEPTVGFMFTDDETILTYEMEYDSAINFSEMEDTDLPLFGGEYYVLSATNSTSILELLDSAEKNVLSEGETVTVAGKTISIEYISSTEVKFNVDGELTDKLEDHEYFELADESYIVANEVLYADKEAGISKVEFSIGAGLMKLEDTKEIEINDEDIDGVYVAFTKTSDQLTKINFTWKSHKDTFLTEANSLVMPGFEVISMAFGGLDIDSDAEVITFSSGDTLELQMDNFDIPLMNSKSDAVYLGEDGNYLVTTTSTELNLSQSTGYGDNSTNLTTGLTLMEGDRFIVTILEDDNSDIEQEYYEVTSIDYTDSSDVELELEDLIGDNDLSFDEIEDLDRGEFNFKITEINGTQVYLNFTGGTGDTVTFNKIVSDKGAVITVPALARAIATTAGFTLTEADEEEDVDGGVDVTIGVTNSTNDKLYATVANSGTVTKEETSDDKFVGYVESVLASKIITDESGDEYDLAIEYTGVEATADVQVATGEVTFESDGASALGDVLVKDSEVDSVSSKNLIIVGGSCINTAAATVLGGAYCGPAFTEATGVGTGQFMIKGVMDTFTTGKLALVVAGYEAADTVNAATYLTKKTVDTSETYTGTSATEATLVVA